jgi:glycosyltransferase involved in cell wall biosynthesis
MNLTGRRIALYFMDLAHGGAERVWITLAREFARRGAAVDLVVERPDEPCEPIPPGVRMVVLEPDFTSRASHLMALRAHPLLLARHWRQRNGLLGRDFRLGPALARYLRSDRPDVLLAADGLWIMRAHWALAAARAPTRFIAVQHTAYSQTLSRSDRPRTPSALRRQTLRRRLAPRLLRAACARAHAVVGVSQGVADDLARVTAYPRGRIAVIHEPVIGESAQVRLEEPLSHPWFAPGEPPVVLAVARLAYQKNLDVLLHAFARLRAQRPARLIILGDGKERSELEVLARTLGIAADVAMPGFVANPYPWYARAGVFALSSRFEGFGMVIAEALYCGCPVVSTDCPYGPAEILDGGRYGRLVPVGDDAALAAALAQTLAAPPNRAVLHARGAEFTVTRAVDRYLALLGGEPLGASEPQVVPG